jgi:hypothetical protein
MLNLFHPLSSEEFPNFCCTRVLSRPSRAKKGTLNSLTTSSSSPCNCLLQRSSMPDIWRPTGILRRLREIGRKIYRWRMRLLTSWPFRSSNATVRRAALCPGNYARNICSSPKLSPNPGYVGAYTSTNRPICHIRSGGRHLLLEMCPRIMYGGMSYGRISREPLVWLSP